MAHALNASRITAPLAAPADKAAPGTPSIFTRLYNAMVEARYQSALREIRRHEAMVKGFEATSGVSAWTLPFQSDAK